MGEIAKFPYIFYKTSTDKELYAVPGDYLIPLGKDTTGIPYCALGLMQIPSNIPYLIFGDSLMRNYFFAYDKNTEKIGWGKPNTAKKTATTFLTS